MRNKTFIILAVFFATGAYAEGIFDTNIPDIFNPVSTDLSLNYLRMLFGTVGNALVSGAANADGDIISRLFNVFNTGIMVFAGTFISYTIFSSVLNTAQDGGGAGGQGKGAVWPTFRIIFGVSLLMPMYNGYSMAQVSVMWSVVQGVGLAGTMWDSAVDRIVATGGGMLSPAHDNSHTDILTFTNNKTSVSQGMAIWQPVAEGKKASATDFMASAACLAYLRSGAESVIGDVEKSTGSLNVNEFNPAVRVGADCQPGSYNDPYLLKKSKDLPDNIICFGVKTNPEVCGSYTWDLEDDSGSNVNASVSGLLQQTASNYFSTMQNTYGEILTFLENNTDKGDKEDFSTLFAAKTALEEDDLNFICRLPADDDFSRLGNCFPGISLASTGSQYYSTVLPARLIIDADDEGVKQREAWQAEAKRNGWIMAGQSYHNFATTENSSASTLEAVGGYQFTVRKTGMLPTIFSVNQNDFLSCINSSSSLGEKAITFNNLGNRVGDINGSARQGGAVIINPKSKYFVANCILVNSLSDYAGYATLQLEAINAATLSSRINEGEVNIDSGSTLSQLNYITRDVLNLLTGNPFVGGNFMDSSTIGGKVYLDVAQDNITSMLFNIYGKMLGFYPFEANNAPDDSSLESTFSDGVRNANGKSFRVLPSDFNSECKDAKERCDADIDTCFSKAIADKEGNGCIQPGQGILGAMASAYNGERVDHLLLLSNLGMSMINNAVFYWTKTIAGTYTIVKKIANNYMDEMRGYATVGAMGSAMKSTGLATPPWGAVFAGLGAGIEFGSKVAIEILKFQYSFVIVNVGLYLPFGAILAGMFFSLGAVLGLYLPLIPFLTFLFGAIGWLIAVVEAMVAAPLVALGVTHPQGHDLLGKAEQAVILLLGIFVRPAAMIIGFILAILLTYVAMEMLNVGFLAMLSNYLGHSVSGSMDLQNMTNLVGFCGILIIYVYVCLSVVNQSFSLIYQVTEKILRWIGGQPEANTTAQMMGEIKGGAKDSSGQAGQGAQQSASQAPQVSPGMQPGAMNPGKNWAEGSSDDGGGAEGSKVS